MATNTLPRRRAIRVARHLVLAAAGAVLVHHGAGAAEIPPALAELIPAAKSEGVLNLSWGAGTYDGGPGIQRFQEEFNKYYGMNARFMWTPSAGFQRHALKALQEYQARQKASADILLAGDANLYFFVETDLLAPVDWAPLLPHIPADTLEKMTLPDGSLIAIHGRVTVISHNTRLVPPDKAPRTLKDLLDPKWKGKIGSTPYAAGFQILANDPRWGAEKTLDFAQRLSANLAGFLACSEYDRLASGEFAIMALECEPGTLDKKAARGMPVAWTIPEDAQQILYRWIGFPKNAVNPNMAKLFIAWLMTPEGQKVMYEANGDDLNLLKGSRTAAKIAEAQRKSGKEFHDQHTREILRTTAPRDIDSQVAKIFRSRVK